MQEYYRFFNKLAPTLARSSKSITGTEIRRKIDEDWRIYRINSKDTDAATRKSLEEVADMEDALSLKPVTIDEQRDAEELKRRKRKLQNKIKQQECRKRKKKD